MTCTAADGGSQVYNFTYDAFGNMLTAKVGQGTIASYTYGDNNGRLEQMTYGNGDWVSYTYDGLGRSATVTYDDGRVQFYAYNGEGQLYSRNVCLFWCCFLRIYLDHSGFYKKTVNNSDFEP